VDATTEARKLLSAIARTGQRFGLNHVVDVLRGVASEKIQRNAHDQLSVYGIGKETPKSRWVAVAQALMKDGKLAASSDEFHTLQLTQQSMPLLKGETSVAVPLPTTAPEDDASRGKPRGDRKADSFAGPVDETLFERLRALRRRLALDQGIPPYMVFGDIALKAMASSKPVTLEMFATIPGVGAHKLEKYGETFTREIAEYANAQ
jgi:ATP-dependent DNA helicase RecQ